MSYAPLLRRALVLLVVLLSFALLLVLFDIDNLSVSYISGNITYPTETIAVSAISSFKLLSQRPSGGAVFEPDRQLYYDYGDTSDATNATETGRYQLIYSAPDENTYLRPLLQCPVEPNQVTGHIRLKDAVLRRISVVVTGEGETEQKGYFNPTILSLPSWSPNQYLLVGRAVTDGSIQQTAICEANICYTDAQRARTGEQPCGENDLELLGGAEGLRCATTPFIVDVAGTPAKSCIGDEMLVDIPGFHDPRIFWSGYGEPIMIMNSHSQYTCFGLWAIDLRKVYAPLLRLLINPQYPTMGPLMSYPALTELTRNPPESRSFLEKNWMMFSSPSIGNYVHYELGASVRSFAKLLGNGRTTFNLTDPYEQPCLQEGAHKDKINLGATWHQGTNSLRLVLCERTAGCKINVENTVFWAIVHHKHRSPYGIPLRYERYVVMWSATPPFNMLAMSSSPILLANETAEGWNDKANWDDDPEAVADKRGKFAGFTYTVSIAYAGGRQNDGPWDKSTGYLDDEVILGIGVDDKRMNYAIVTVSDLLHCLRTCPPRAEKPLDGGEDALSKTDVGGLPAHDRFEEQTEKSTAQDNNNEKQKDAEQKKTEQKKTKQKQAEEQKAEEKQAEGKQGDEKEAEDRQAEPGIIGGRTKDSVGKGEDNARAQEDAGKGKTGASDGGDKAKLSVEKASSNDTIQNNAQREKVVNATT